MAKSRTDDPLSPITAEKASATKIIVSKFQRDSGDNELKQGTKVIVRESQAAVFLKEGQMADILFPGTYSLDTDNLPILSSLKAFPYFFLSPVIADVYFVSMKQFIDNKWATKNPIMKRDRDFNMVRIRAFGKFAFRISDVASFMLEIFGTRQAELVPEHPCYNQDHVNQPAYPEQSKGEQIQKPYSEIQKQKPPDILISIKKKYLEVTNMAKCPVCGAPMENEICGYCGNNDFIAFIHILNHIQKLVSYSVQQSHTDLPQQVVYTQIINQSVNPGIVPGISRKKRMTALLLCIFLGEFGIHRFYVGKIGTGLLYLFTLGLFGIGWLNKKGSMDCALCIRRGHFIGGNMQLKILSEKFYDTYPHNLLLSAAPRPS